MAQPIQGTPVVSANLAGTKQQVNLRDYLNVRIAPFLKRALNEALDAEVQYPLQWLGEHLIQQSVLFEGNPDSTNIQERFLYKHDVPKPAEIPPPPPSAAQSSSVAPVTDVAAPAAPAATTDSMESPAVTAESLIAQAREVEIGSAGPAATEINGTAPTNGDATADPAPAQDTEMSNAP